jgi:hypothetical protein
MCSGSKIKEISGSGIFAAHSEDGDSDTGSGASNPPNKTSARVYQVFLTHTIN